MKIAIFGTSEEEQKALVDLIGNVGELSFYTDRLTEENASEVVDAEIISIFVGSEIEKNLIKLLPNLKLLITRSTGYDHINLKYASKKGIKVANIPSYGSRTVAEFTFALMLMLSRKTFDAYHNLREGMKYDITGLRGFDLRGKTLGVVGLGKIGRNVVEIAKGFNMNVIGCDKHPDEGFLKKHSFLCVDLPDLLRDSDIVSLHVPYMKETHHLLNKKMINMMKDGAYLINTSRGEIIDTDALVGALRSGKLAGAGLDVLEGERQLQEEIELVLDHREWRKDFKTLLENHILIDLPNVIVTPHVAFFTKEAERRILETTAENIKGFIAGTPQNIVNK